ncbi:hydroxyethylthiazole kinase [Tanacetum coccineum]|uniref:Hydroxyethylthiazole kinase n=1 Tax=Tanacetum coccineum TaxID=301880 RepID=A0ABQ5I819_9ASTR
MIFPANHKQVGNPTNAHPSTRDLRSLTLSNGQFWIGCLALRPEGLNNESGLQGDIIMVVGDDYLIKLLPGDRSPRSGSCLSSVAVKPNILHSSRKVNIVYAFSLACGYGARDTFGTLAPLNFSRSLCNGEGRGFEIAQVSLDMAESQNGQRVMGAHKGVQIAQTISATRCAVSVVIAAFITIEPHHAFKTTTSVFDVYALAGELAMGLAKGLHNKSVDQKPETGLMHDERQSLFR